MALTNIELYEQLKKDVSEESARMIAEGFALAGDLTTKDDFVAMKDDFLVLKSDFTELRSEFSALELRLEQRFSAFELRMEQRFSAFERRVMRWSLALVLPLWGAVVAGLVKIVIKI
jgi:hypothetical protein